jgi:hypothetical protein
MTKDAHLLGAGLEHDGRILSLDDKARGLFASIVSKTPRVGSIHWANPSVADEQVVAWVKRGVPDDAARQLRAHPRAQ